MNGLRRLLTIAGLIFFLLPCGVNAQSLPSAEEDFFEANSAYKRDQFQEAVNGYRKLIENGFESGHIYYNLANAYFRLGDSGKAILYYERARTLIPRDDDLIFNLANARNQTVDALGDPETDSLNDFLGLDSLNLHETIFVFSIVNVLFFLVITIRLFKKAEWSYYLSIFLIILIAISAGTLALKWYGASTDNRAVILAEEIVVRAGPDTGDTVLFKIHEGAVVHYERSEGDWVLLYLSKDKRGWVEAGQLERVDNREGAASTYPE